MINAMKTLTLVSKVLIVLVNVYQINLVWFILFF